MPVVSNTSPILNLAIIGELSLLRQQFGEILIPRAVLEEFQVSKNLLYSYVKAVIVTKIHTLQVYLGEDLVEIFDYQLPI